MAIYVIGNVGMKVYKIGFSKDVTERLAAIQTGCPHKLQLICKFSYDNLDDSKVEVWAHTKFKKHRLEGEWFQFNEVELVNVICFLTNPFEVTTSRISIKASDYVMRLELQSQLFLEVAPKTRELFFAICLHLQKEQVISEQTKNTSQYNPKYLNNEITITNNFIFKYNLYSSISKKNRPQ